MAQPAPVPRRSLLGSAALAAAVGLTGAGAAGAAYLEANRNWGLWTKPNTHGDAVVFTGWKGAPGGAPLSEKDAAAFLRAGEIPGISRELVTARGLRSTGRSLVPGTRVVAGCEGESALVAVTEAFLARSRLHHVGAFRDLETSALLDLHSLTWALPSPVAGWHPLWRYTWPRDTAHVITALAERGHTAWALGLLEQLATLADPEGEFEARYIPGTGRAPDSRPRQFDGTAWVLWAASRILSEAEAAGSASLFRLSPALDAALTRCTRALQRATRNGRRLPEPSPDYWERDEQDLTLSIAAMTLAGLRAAEHLSSRGGFLRGLGADASSLSTEANRVEAAVVSGFFRWTLRGPRFTRYMGGGGSDMGQLMLLKPYGVEGLGDSPINGVMSGHPGLLEDAFAAMRRPAGGVAPAQLWKLDGVSWTPQTMMFAQAWAARGAMGSVTPLLSWIRQHRSPLGAVPEKVLASGANAGVAPLAWTAALTLSTLVHAEPHFGAR